MGINSGKPGVLLIGPMEITEKMYAAPPLGIHRIAGLLNRNEIDARVVDPNIEGIPETSQFDVIGYSVLGSNLEEAIRHSRQLDKRPGQRIVFGGYEATFNFEYIARNANVDAVIVGEGEYPMLHYTLSESLNSFPGIYHVMDGEIIDQTAARPLTTDQFADVVLNMDYSRVPYEKYWAFNEAKLGPGFNPAETKVIRLFLKSRCSFNCNFCSSANFFKKACGKNPPVITIDPSLVADLLVRIKQLFPETKTIFFQDDEIFYPHKYIFDLCNEILLRPELKGLSYLCQGRLDGIPPALLPLLAQCGFRMISMGVESFSPRILKELAPSKAAKMSDSDVSIQRIIDNGIMPYINIILTSPSARVDDVLQTLDKCLDLCEQGAEIGMNLYTMCWNGSEMAKWDVLRDGLNILPNDDAVRDLVDRCDQWYKRFLAWCKEKCIPLSIDSPRRSILYMLMIYRLLGRTTNVKRCLDLLSTSRIFSERGDREQTDAVLEVLDATE
jgi:radical SAM superfamily enzyme YgiQ (UPF0313 family)